MFTHTLLCKNVSTLIISNNPAQISAAGKWSSTTDNGITRSVTKQKPSGDLPEPTNRNRLGWRKVFNFCQSQKNIQFTKRMKEKGQKNIQFTKSMKEKTTEDLVHKKNERKIIQQVKVNEYLCINCTISYI